MGAWLFLGVANTDALLYDDEWQDVLKSHPNNFRLDYALSREQTNKDGGKMYIQDKVKEYADEVFDRMDKGAHIYFCGPQRCWRGSPRTRVSTGRMSRRSGSLTASGTWRFTERQAGPFANFRSAFLSVFQSRQSDPMPFAIQHVGLAAYVRACDIWDGFFFIFGCKLVA